MKTLQELRHGIDKIDEQIQNLIENRVNLALEVGKVKSKDTSKKPVIYRPEREAEILQQVSKRNQGPLLNKDLANIFQAIITASRSIQQPPKVSFLGPLGTFSHEAVISKFGDAADILPQASIQESISAVAKGEADYAIVPIENSTEGVVNKTLDCCIDTSITVCAELILPVHHYLLSRETDLKQITQVYSHPQALAQCQRWLEKNLPHAALLPAKSTSQACMLAAREANTAAVAGKMALDQHKLNVLAEHIQDEANNATRFYVMGKQTPKPTGQDKTSLLIWLPHKPGALALLLEHFAKNSINLTLIESRPSKQQSWEYYFFLEIEGHQDDKAVSAVLQQLTQTDMKVKILGSFPRTIS